MNVKDLLRGCEVGGVQTVGVMSVIPLVSDVQDLNYLSPKGLKIGTTNYGTMEFKNEQELPVIIPTGVSYLTKRAGQDHAMCTPGFVGAGRHKKYDNAACIQQSQGGRISLQEHAMNFVPWSLREYIMQVNTEKSYGKLWSSISNYNSTVGLAQQGHLEYFYDTFKEQLEEFVAQFELVRDQVGAIILINGSVFGVERAPSAKYFEDIFQPLIRDYYGGVAIQISRGMNYTMGTDHKIRFPIDSTKVSDIESLKEQLAKANNKEISNIKDIARAIMEQEVVIAKTLEEISDKEIVQLSTQQFGGDAFFQGEFPIYSSLFSKKEYLKNQKWFKSKEFSI